MNAINMRIEQMAERAKSAFAGHHVRQLLDVGLYRHWVCAKPGDCAYAFEVTTFPHWLVVTGDIGELMVSRMPDMIPWCRGSINSVSYFAEKVPNNIEIREYDPGLAREWLEETLGQANAEGLGQEAKEALRDMLDERAYNDETQFTHDLNESGVNDGNDWPLVENYTYGFLWCREAVKFLLANLPA